MRTERQHWSTFAWLAGATLVAGVWTIQGCGSSDDAGDPGASSSGGGASSSSGAGSSSGGSSSGSSSGTTSSGGSSGTTSSSGDGGSTGALATDKNFKVAFIGDTDQGTNFKNVVTLIKNEGAQLVVVQGDLTYSGHSASSWFSAIDGIIQTNTVKIPYFASKGNHDTSWTNAGGLGAGFDTRLTDWSVTPDDGKPSEENYALTFKGLKLVFVGDSGGTSDTVRPDYVKTQLANDKHIWKVCSWHKNQRATNVGPKSDEMGWAIYENCREAGAIVAQGHSHTYSRSKTITADQQQTVDPTCGDPFDVCVAPGKHFFFDASLGGVETRTADSTWAAKSWWGATYDADYGALFIEFNVDNDPKKAHAYFKTVGGTIVDPPSSSGKTYFTITAQ